MVSFKRPALLHSWTEGIVWALVPAALMAGAIAFLIIGPAPARIVGAVGILGIATVLWRKFGPRQRDRNHLAYRTRHGVGVVIYTTAWLDRIDAERAIDRAIAIYGNAHRLDGVALYVVPDARVLGDRVGGVADLDVTVQWPEGQSLTHTLNLITHECSHLLLDGHPDVEHARMGKDGVL